MLQTSIQELPLQIFAQTPAIMTQVSVIFLNHPRILLSLDHDCLLSNLLSTHLPFQATLTEIPLTASQNKSENSHFILIQLKFKKRNEN
jgi:hypothetical protein